MPVFEHGCIRHQNPTSKPILFSENPTCQYNYEWETPAGCPQDAPPDDAEDPGNGGSGGSGGLSGGDVFLIMYIAETAAIRVLQCVGK